MNANPTVLVVQHEADSPLAALEPPLAALGVHTQTWQALSQPEPPAGEFDGLIVLGGIVNPDGTDGDAPLDREREEIAAAHERGIPVLGICLGAQLLSQALGGSAQRMPVGTGEIGWVRIELDPAAADDLLLMGTPPTMSVLEWHNYACTPPAGAVRLGHSPACVQAFRVGATSWGLQFHVEATRPLLEEWTVAGASELEARGIRPAAVLGTGSQRAEQLLLATRIADRFARAVLAAAIPA